ncbi:hypothetical protein C8R44DRAFT_733107 [Mycena epipterygia]|nr:hypothetical protein C8R44DRAFT_733107 [Mycena epipterygia]
MYVPHIATVIHEQNIALAAGKGKPGAIHLNLESMMISNPISWSQDATSHFTWLLQTRCYLADMYNASTCAEMFEILPACLDSIQLAQQGPGWSEERRVEAAVQCYRLEKGDTHGTVVDDVRKKASDLQHAGCDSKDPLGCIPPSFGWTESFFRRADIKNALGIPEHINFSAIAEDVNADFWKYGDSVFALRTAAHRQNQAPPLTTHTQLKLLKSPFQDEFLRTPDIPWPTAEDATARVVGEGAGNMTYILVDQAGHFWIHETSGRSGPAEACQIDRGALGT